MSHAIKREWKQHNGLIVLGILCPDYDPLMDIFHSEEQIKEGTCFFCGKPLGKQIISFALLYFGLRKL